MSRDIDKEKKDQRKAECAALREVRKQQVLQTVLRASSLSDAAKTLDTDVKELQARLEKYGVKHNYRELWSAAVKEYIEAGQPHQYELNISSLSEFVTTPPTKRELYEDAMRRKSIQNYDIEFKLEEEIKQRNSDLETKLKEKLLEAVREGYDEAELIVPDPASPHRTIKYTLPLR